MEMKQGFRWTFNWSRREYAQAVASVLKHAGRSKMVLFRRFVGWGVFVLVVLSVLWTAISGDRQQLASTMPWAVVTLLMLGLFRWGFPWLHGANYPKKGRGQLEFWANETEVGQSSPMASTTAPWRAIERVVETDDMLLFYSAPSIAYFAPKRIIEQSELAEFREFVVGKVPIVDRRKRSGV
jgi:hypothetical protein